MIFYTLRQPKIYEATCTIEYDPNPTRPLGRDVEDVANPASSFWATREFFATQNRVISSRTVAERVVRELGLHQDPSFAYVPDDQRADWRGIDVEQAAGLLRSRLSVEPVDDTRLVAIRVRDRDPERAATLANAVAEAYIEKTLEDRMGSTVSALEWLGTQLDTLQTQLGESELSLHRFKEEHNVLSVSMEDRQNLVAADIEHFNVALTKVRTRRIELAARVSRIQTAMNGDSPEAAFAENMTLAELRERLREKLALREGLRTRYGPNHQQMRTLDAEVGDLRRQLGEEMDGLLRAARADLLEASRIESGLRAALDEAHHAGLELNLREIEYQRLNRERENNAKLYNLVLERTTETDLTRMLRTTHVRLLDRALHPEGAISPKVATNAVTGIGAGLVLGLALAVLLGRLESVADVEALGVTILGILPRIEDEAEAKTPSKTRRRKGKADDEGERELFVHTHPMSSAAECCRTIRTNLTFMSADEPIRSIVISSARPREGKTTIASNIAVSFAQSGKRVLLVDTDLRRPRIHRIMGVSGSAG